MILLGSFARPDPSHPWRISRPSLPPNSSKDSELPASFAAAARPWHSCGMPDYSLFGDAHVKKYEETGGKVGHDWNGTDCLILRVKGRKTGELRKFPLIYGRDGQDYVLVASKGGYPKNPGWYENLVANPECEIQVRDAVIPVTARTGTGWPGRHCMAAMRTARGARFGRTRMARPMTTPHASGRAASASAASHNAAVAMSFIGCTVW